jgi:hypothetical protein
LLAALQQFQIASAGNQATQQIQSQTFPPDMVKFTLSPLLSSRLKRVKFEPRFRAWN